MYQKYLALKERAVGWISWQNRLRLALAIFLLTQLGCFLYWGSIPPRASYGRIEQFAYEEFLKDCQSYHVNPGDYVLTKIEEVPNDWGYSFTYQVKNYKQLSFNDSVKHPNIFVYAYQRDLSRYF